jgi:hypothetical protein
MTDIGMAPVGIASSPLRMAGGPGAPSADSGGDFFSRIGLGSFNDFASGLEQLAAGVQGGFARDPNQRYLGQQKLAALQQQAQQVKRDALSQTFKHFDDMATLLTQRPDAFAALQPLIQKQAANLQRIGVADPIIQQATGYLEALSKMPAPTGDPYTLSPGQQRFDGHGKVIASVPATDAMAEKINNFTTLMGRPPNEREKLDLIGIARPPQGPGPTELQRNLIAAGIDPRSPQGQQILRSALPSTAPFQGQGVEQQDSNTLLTGDPSTPAYALSYWRMSQPKPVMTQQQNSDGTTSQVMVLVPQQLPASIRPPTNPIQNAAGSSPASASQPGTGVSPESPVSAAAPPPATPQQPTKMVVGTEKPNESMTRNKQLYGVAKAEVPIIDQNFNALTEPGNQAAGSMTATKFLTTPEYKRASNSLKVVIRNYLYSVSGQNATDTEVQAQADALLPAFGDDKQTVQDKLERVHRMVDSIAAGAGMNTEAMNAEKIPSDLPKGTTYVGPTKDGKTAYKLPDGSLVAK